MGQYGVTELPGTQHNNPQILKYFRSIGMDWVETDEMAWCSAFMNWCAKMSNHEYTKRLNARSWLDVGYPIDQPKPGDVVILWREKIESWRGHVGLFVTKTNTHVWILGGNQTNSVRITRYPIHKVLGYRRLKYFG